GIAARDHDLAPCERLACHVLARAKCRLGAADRAKGRDVVIPEVQHRRDRLRPIHHHPHGVLHGGHEPCRVSDGSEGRLHEIVEGRLRWLRTSLASRLLARRLAYDVRGGRQQRLLLTLTDDSDHALPPAAYETELPRTVCTRRTRGSPCPSDPPCVRIRSSPTSAAERPPPRRDSEARLASPGRARSRRGRAPRTARSRETTTVVLPSEEQRRAGAPAGDAAAWRRSSRTV